MMVLLKKNVGFTLIELLIIVAIISILAGITVPSFQRMVEKMSLEAYAQQLAGDIRYIRQMRMNGDDYSITLKEKNYQIIKRTSRVKFVSAPPGVYYDGSSRKIKFSYTGATAGEGMTLIFFNSYGDSLKITITPVTGRVRVYSKLNGG